MTDARVQAVLLTGPVGAGKTAVAMELGELLAELNLPTAVIDLDWLGWLHMPGEGGPSPDELIVANLASVWPRFRDAGARYLVLARALTSARQVEAVGRALPGVEMKVVLVSASRDVIEERLGRRDEGAVLEEHLAEAAAMAEALGEAGFEDFRVDNERLPARDAARSLLRELGWGGSG